MPSAVAPSSSTIRIVPQDLAWRVIADADQERMVDTLCTRERALEHARELARDLVRRGRERAVRIRLEDRSGRVEEHDVEEHDGEEHDGEG